MCDFSLQHARSRKAVVADKLITKNFGAGTNGFADVADSGLAVCALPGTEIAFDEPIRIFSSLWSAINPFKAEHKTARFRQVNKEKANAHHDAIELPSGEIVMLTQLIEGQRATVLQLPAEPKTPAEAEEQKRVEFVG